MPGPIYTTAYKSRKIVDLIHCIPYYIILRITYSMDPWRLVRKVLPGHWITVQSLNSSLQRKVYSPVSYTHLDVYKRQISNRRARLLRY